MTEDYFATKFRSARDEVLYDLHLDSSERCSGDAEAPTGWFAGMVITADEIHAIARRPEVVEFQFKGQFPLTDTGLTDQFAGFFLIGGNDQGFVYVERCISQADLDGRIAELDAAYGAWLDTDEDNI